MNIYLIGFMGSGKSTISRYLCEHYGKRRLEMDEEIARQEGMSIPEIFERKGEAYFRVLETELLKKISGETELVVSCGGGTPMREVNVKQMKENGRVVLLKASAGTVYERVKNSHNRPLLEGHMNVAYIQSLMDARQPKYEAAADFAVGTDGRAAGDICREIIEKAGQGANLNE